MNSQLTGKKVSDLMTDEIISIDSEDTLENVGKMMVEKQVSMLVVTENRQIVGLITAGDWFKSFYLHVASHLPETRFRTDAARQTELQEQKLEMAKKHAAIFKQMKAQNIMNPHFKTIDANASLIDAVHEMKATDLRRLLVTDNEGKIIGVLGRTRAINALLAEL